jgi:hypothetical protein
VCLSFFAEAKRYKGFSFFTIPFLTPPPFLLIPQKLSPKTFSPKIAKKCPQRQTETGENEHFIKSLLFLLYQDK